MNRRDYDDPRCDHNRDGVLVTNQPENYDSTRSHRSAWVCRRPECVFDAIAWVMRGTGEQAWWRIGVNGTWHDEMYEVTS